MSLATRCLVAACALGLLVPQPAHAGPTDKLVGIIRSAKKSKSPLALLRELRSVGKISLSDKHIKAAIKKTKPRGALRQLLKGITRLQVVGNQVRILREAPVQIRLKSGDKIALAQKSGFTFGGSGNNTSLSVNRGIRVAEKGGSLYSLKKVQFASKGGRPVAKITAGVGVFTKEVTAYLDGRPAPQKAKTKGKSARGGSKRKGGPRRGVIGALGA